MKSITCYWAYVHSATKENVQFQLLNPVKDMYETTLLDETKLRECKCQTLYSR